MGYLDGWLHNGHVTNFLSSLDDHALFPNLVMRGKEEQKEEEGAYYLEGADEHGEHDHRPTDRGSTSFDRSFPRIERAARP